MGGVVYPPGLHERLPDSNQITLYIDLGDDFTKLIYSATGSRGGVNPTWRRC